MALILVSFLAPATLADEKAGSRFTSFQVADHVWRIDDGGADNLYLVAGTANAVLIDTGLGVDDLAKFVRTLTPLPVTVVVTHGHPDHAGGAIQFPKVYAHPDDFDAVRRFSLNDANELVPVNDGFVFDLGGGRALKVIATPGHTRGSICLLQDDLKLLFSGDNDNPIQWQFLPESTTLDTWLRGVERLEARKDFETVLPGHGAALDKAYLAALTACARTILDGSCVDTEYVSPAGKARLCRCGRASVAFDPARLRATTGQTEAREPDARRAAPGPSSRPGR